MVWEESDVEDDWMNTRNVLEWPFCSLMVHLISINMRGPP